MFLVTTANRNFWKCDEEILFLGEWCKLHKDREFWGKLKTETLPYHWDDRDRLSRDFLSVQNIYSEFLEQCSNELNRIHRVSFNRRYWEILIGPWLFQCIAVLFDRYLSVKAAENTGRVTRTFVSEVNTLDAIPYDTRQFILGTLEDDFNQYLFSLIIKDLSKISYEKVKSSLKFYSLENKPVSKTGLGAALRDISTKLLVRFPKNLIGSVFVSKYLSLSDFFRLKLKIREIPIRPNVTVGYSECPADKDLRGAISLVGKDPFGKFLARWLPFLLPRIFLELYPGYRKQALQAYPRKPPSIVMSHEYHLDEAFKFWASESVQNGAVLIGSQHGGVYGTSAISFAETHEQSIADYYLTWGWTDRSYKAKTVGLPAPFLTKFSKSVKADPSGKILFVGSLFSRYFYLFYSVPLGPQVADDLKDQMRMVSEIKKLDSKAYSLLKLRLYPGDFQWGELDRWKEMDPALDCNRASGSFEDAVNNSRLCLMVSCSTVFVQVLAANIPSVAFLNPKYWQFHDRSSEVMNELRKAGIVHDTIESAAAHVVRVANNPSSWWLSEETQAARRKFCEQFAKTSDSFIDDWTRFFGEMKRKWERR